MKKEQQSSSGRAVTDHSGEPQNRATLKSDTGPRSDPPARTSGNHPVDPNSAAAKISFPPGVDPRDVRDPGRQTPGAPPVQKGQGKP